MDPTSNVDMDPASNVDMDATRNVNMDAASNVHMKLTSNVDVDATSNVDMPDPTSNVDMDATSNVDMELTSNVDVDATSNVDMPDPTSNVDMDATCNVDMELTSNVDVDATSNVDMPDPTSNVDMDATSNVDMELTSNIDVDATSNADMPDPTNNVDMLDPTRNVNMDATCNVDMELTSNIDTDATSNVDMPDPTSNVNMDATSNVGVDSNVDMDSSGSEYRTEIDSDEDSCDSGEIVCSSDVNEKHSTRNVYMNATSNVIMDPTINVDIDSSGSEYRTEINSDEDSCDSGEIVSSSDVTEKDYSDDTSDEIPVAPQKILHVQALQKKYDKRHACVYCSKLLIKIARHLERSHKNEPEIIKLSKVDKNSPERQDILAGLRNRGDFKHNSDVIKKCDGMVITKRRPRRSKVPRLVSEYLPCRYCRVMLLTKDLRVHAKRCKLNQSIHHNAQRREYTVSGRLMLPIPKNMDARFYKQVILTLRDDEVAAVVKSDYLILKFGKRKFYKKDLEEHSHNIVCNKMRELARLVLKGKELYSDMQTVSDFINPLNFERMITIVQTIAEFNVDTRKFNKPNLVLSLGQSLYKCAQIEQSLGNTMNDEPLISSTERFLKLYRADWNDLVSGNALLNIHVNRGDKYRLLPLCKDITTLYGHIKSVTKSMNSSPLTISNYSKFCKYTMCEINMFNGKRGGEVQRLKLGDLKMKDDDDDIDEEVLKTLDAHEIRLCKVFQRVEIRGKFGSRVALLLTENMRKSLAVLQEAKVAFNFTSDYVFIRPTGSRPFRGPDALREISSKVMLARPEAMTFTKLRKHLATFSQVAEISETTQDILAKFMGHDLRVHRSVYRMPVDVLDKAKVAKLLMKLHEGNGDWSNVEVNENGR